MVESEKEWLLLVDGAARGNPGEAGCGAAICDENGAVVKELSRYLGRATNNVAEYEALLWDRGRSSDGQEKDPRAKRFAAIGSAVKR